MVVLLGRGEIGGGGGGEVVYVHPGASLQEKNAERLVKADLEKIQFCLTQCKI